MFLAACERALPAVLPGTAERGTLSADAWDYLAEAGRVCSVAVYRAEKSLTTRPEAFFARYQTTGFLHLILISRVAARSEY